VRPVLLLAFALFSLPVLAASVGQVLANVEIRNANNEPAKIPNLGKKVLSIFYTDPDVSDLNDPFADALNAANLSKEAHQGIGIANLKDTWLPGSVVRAVVRRKIEKYDSVILTDPDHLLATAWGMGDCNEQSVVLVIDKTSKLRYMKRGAMSAAEIEAGLALVKQLIAE
jgi:predicted transcriptional regulator